MTEQTRKMIALGRFEQALAAGRNEKGGNNE